MRKAVILFVMAMLLAFPAAAHAQSAVAFDNMVIQFWPDYDQPEVLVIYDFVVSADTALPAAVNVRLPAGARLLAVARQESGGLMNVEYTPPRRQGEYDVLALSVTDRAQYHVEFYIDYTREGTRRSFTYIWPGNYAVANLKVRFQEPVGAKNVTVDPAMTPSGPEQDGFTYQNATLTQLAADKAVSFKFSYDKENDALSAASLGVQPTAPLDQRVSGQASFMTYIPWILGGLGVVLIVGGGMWYWLSGRSSGGGSGSRKRHASRADEEAGGEVYCSQCGKRAQPGDRFCRACGARLRAPE